MAKQMLLYESLVPVARDRHAGWSLDRGNDFSYCKAINACPLMIGEFSAAASSMPIVFSRSEDGVIPTAVLGIEADRSALVAEDGSWTGRYVPAFLRRYPFILATREGGTEYTLCLDETYSGLDRSGQRGARLFTETGEPTDVMTGSLEFAKNFQVETQRTQTFCKILQELGLLENMNVQIKLADGRQHAMTGFQTISRDRLKALPAEAVKTLFDSDGLELIYLHLASLANMNNLADRRF